MHFLALSETDLVNNNVCGDPSKPINGQRIGRNFGVGGVVTYRCDNGYEMEDMKYSHRTCLQNGTWTGRVPTCNGMF